MDKDLAYILHIRDAILLLEEYTSSMSKEEFAKNFLVRDGTVHQIQIIGEATKKLSEDFKNNYKDIPWNEIAKMRDRIVHHYFDIDINVVWDVVKYDIPSVKESVLDYISKKE